jgi:hypothetical protein
MTRDSRGWNEDRGAILVHVAIVLLALVAFTTFVADFGLLWVSRRQAQNAADSAALAGAVALAFDNPSDLTDTGPAKESAFAESQRNFVWGQVPSVISATDITFATCPDGGANCIRVNVYRNAARANPLPIFFGYFVGLTSQSIQGTATGEVGSANATNCLKPWAIQDQFIDNNGNGVYDPGIDTYIAPTSTNPGTGYTVSTTYGTEFDIKYGSQIPRLSPGWMMALDFGSGANTYNAAITGCIGSEYGIGDTVPTETGDMSGPTTKGVQDLIAEDPNAQWDGTKIINSCVSSPTTCPSYTQSPRIVPVPVFDTNLFATTGVVKIVNIFGFFVERVDGNGNQNDVWGRLINVPAFNDPSKSSVDPNSAYLKTVYLVR